MSAHRSPKGKAPPSATKSAATGRGDLLRAWAAGVELAPSFLGYEFTPIKSPDAQALASANQQPSKAGESSKAKAAAPLRTPLRMPLAYAVMNIGGDPPPESEEALQWTPMDKAEWGAYFQPHGAQPLVLDPLWPHLAQARAWLDAAAVRQAGTRVDWARTTQRLAQGQALQRLPLRAAKAAPTDVHLLIDGSAPFQALEGDAKVLVGHLLGLCGRNLHVWRLPAGPEGQWRPVGAPHAKPPAHWHGSLLLVFSDVGVVTGGSAAWQRALGRWAHLGAQVHLLFPGFRHELPSWLAQPASCVEPDSSSGNGQEPPSALSSGALDRLMQALSVALVLDAPLVRRVRQRLCGGASPLLELRLAAHPAIWQSALGVAQWRHGERAPYQDALADTQQWSVAQCQALASVVSTCHTHVSQAIRDEELLELASLPHLSVGVAGVGTDEVAAAADRVAQTLGTLREAMLPTAQAPAGAAWHAYVSARCQRAGVGLQRLFPNVADRLAVLHALQAVPAGQPLRTVPPNTADLDAVAPRVQSLKLWLCQDSEGLWLQAATFDSDKPRRAELTSFWAAGRWLRVERGGQLAYLWPLGGWNTDRFLCGHLSEQDLLEIHYEDAVETSEETGLPIRTGCVRLWPIRRLPAIDNFEQRFDHPYSEVPTPWGQSHVLMRDIFAQPEWSILGPAIDLPTNVSLWADDKAVGMSIELDVGEELRLRYIPPGTFLMGSPVSVGNDYEHPQHPVTITQGYWLAETPCTQALWQAVMGDNPSNFKDGADAPKRPVEWVNFSEVEQFLDKLNAMLPKSVEAVLPTEAEWEYACRAGTQTVYWWGDAFDPARANADHANNKDWDDKDGTTPVNRYLPNPWGLYDMHGNVWEWCADARRDYTANTVVNPRGSMVFGARVVRGGSWLDQTVHARSASRFSRPGGNSGRAPNLGFRLVLRSSSPGPEGQE